MWKVKQPLEMETVLSNILLECNLLHREKICAFWKIYILKLFKTVMPKYVSSTNELTILIRKNIYGCPISKAHCAKKKRRKNRTKKNNAPSEKRQPPQWFSQMFLYMNIKVILLSNYEFNIFIHYWKTRKNQCICTVCLTRQQS